VVHPVLRNRQTAQVVARVVQVRTLAWLVTQPALVGLRGEEDILLQCDCYQRMSCLCGV
jgi:hypothetical protein